MLRSVIITGATGFIGAAIVEKLIADGVKVTVLLRPNSDLRRLQKLTGFSSLRYDKLCDKKIITLLCNQHHDVFINCGWNGVSGIQRNEAFQITDNIPFTLDTVELASAIGCDKWIGLGSQAEYGNRNARIDEDCHPRPTTVYGKAKLSAGISALALCEARQMGGVWLRIFSTYGPGDAPHWFIQYIIREMMADRSPELTACEQRWDYLYVTDAANAVIATANSSAEGIFNLGSGTSFPIKHYVEAIKNELKSTIKPNYGSLPYRSDQVMHLEADITHLVTVTGWLPRIPLATGIRNIIDFNRQFFI